MDTQKSLSVKADPLPLEIPFPPRLAEAFGYQGKARFVGFHWDPVGDEVFFDDGQRSGPGEAWAFLAYRQHPTVAPHLDPYNLGYSDLEAEHALLLDRQTDQVQVARLDVVQAFLCQQHPPLLGMDDDPHALEAAVEDILDAAWQEIY